MIFHDLETSGNRSVGFVCRGVAQLGRALRSGRRGRGFESRRLDHKPHYKASFRLRDAVLIFIQ